jgi:hypothetical protein
LFSQDQTPPFDWLALEEFKKHGDISIDAQLPEIEVPSMLEEGNIIQSISKIPSYDRKFLGDKSFSSTSLIPKQNQKKLEVK